MTYSIVHKLNFNFPCPPPFLLQCYMAHGRLAANKSKLEKVQNAQFRESEYLICLCLFCETKDCFSFFFFGLKYAVFALPLKAIRYYICIRLIFREDMENSWWTFNVNQSGKYFSLSDVIFSRLVVGSILYEVLFLSFLFCACLFFFPPNEMQRDKVHRRCTNKILSYATADAGAAATLQISFILLNFPCFMWHNQQCSLHTAACWRIRHKFHYALEFSMEIVLF